MAVTFVKSLGSASSQSGAATTLTVTLTGSVPVGDTIILMFSGWNGFATTPTGADSKGNTYVTDWVNPSASSDGYSSLHRSSVTSALASGDTITLTFTAGGDDVVLIANQFAGIVTTSPVFQVGTKTSASSTTPSNTITPGASPPANSLVIGFLAVGNEGASSVYTEDTDTVAGDTWHTLTRVATTSGRTPTDKQQSQYGAYKIPSSGNTGTALTWNPLLGVSKFWIQNLLIYKGTSGTSFTGSATANIALGDTLAGAKKVTSPKSTPAVALVDTATATHRTVVSASTPGATLGNTVAGQKREASVVSSVAPIVSATRTGFKQGQFAPVITAVVLASTKTATRTTTGAKSAASVLASGTTATHRSSSTPVTVALVLASTPQSNQAVAISTVAVVLGSTTAGSKRVTVSQTSPSAGGTGAMSAAVSKRVAVSPSTPLPSFGLGEAVQPKRIATGAPVLVITTLADGATPANQVVFPLNPLTPIPAPFPVPEPQFRVCIANTLTGQIVGDLPIPPTVPSWSRELNGVGSFSSLSVPLSPKLDPDIWQMLNEPYRWTILLCYGGWICQAGIITDTVADDTVKPPVATITTSTLWDFFATKRLVYQPVANLTDPAANLAFGPLAGIPQYQNVSWAGIASWLLTLATAGPANRALPLVIPPPETGTNIMTYAALDLANVGTRLSELTQMVGGLEMELSPEFVDNTQTYFRWRARMGRSVDGARIGQLGFPHAWDYQKALQAVQVNRSGKAMTFHNLVKGADNRTTTGGTLIFAASATTNVYEAQGWPWLETADTSHSAVIDPTVAQSLADMNVAKNVQPLATASMLVRMDGKDLRGRQTGSPSIADVSVGDTGFAGVQNHLWLPDGSYGFRVLKIENGTDQWTAKLTVQVLGVAS